MKATISHRELVSFDGPPTDQSLLAILKARGAPVVRVGNSLQWDRNYRYSRFDKEVETVFEWSLKERASKTLITDGM